MKLSRLFLAAGVVAGAAVFALAGPPPQLTIHPPSTVKPSAAKTPAPKAETLTAPTPAASTVVSCATCACCKKNS